jgi:hypothetical protein
VDRKTRRAFVVGLLTAVLLFASGFVCGRYLDGRGGDGDSGATAGYESESSELETELGNAAENISGAVRETKGGRAAIEDGRAAVAGGRGELERGRAEVGEVGGELNKLSIQLGRNSGDAIDIESGLSRIESILDEAEARNEGVEGGGSD